MRVKGVGSKLLDFRPGVCEVILNDNESTHQGYIELMNRVQSEKPEMLKQAEFYVIGHEIGHCVYGHLNSIHSPEIEIAFKRDDAHAQEHADPILSAEPPETITKSNKRLHAEIFADVYGIEFASSMLGKQAVGIDDVVLKFRQKVSGTDPSYYTQHYIKSCTGGQLNVLDILVPREQAIPVPPQ